MARIEPDNILASIKWLNMSALRDVDSKLVMRDYSTGNAMSTKSFQEPTRMTSRARVREPVKDSSGCE